MEGWKETTEHSIIKILKKKRKTGRKDNCHMITSHCQENKNYNYFSGVLFRVFMELYRPTKSLHEKDNEPPLRNLQNSPS